MAKGGGFEVTALMAPLMIRLPLGLILMAHGAQKLIGLFGGKGLTATLAGFEKDLGIPPVLTLLAIIAECAGGFGVLSGFLTRLSAAGIATVMLVAMYKVTWINGFFLNTFCVPGRGHGIEFNLALLGMALYLVLAGGGRWCLDRLVFKR